MWAIYQFILVLQSYLDIELYPRGQGHRRQGNPHRNPLVGSWRNQWRHRQGSKVHRDRSLTQSAYPKYQPGFVWPLPDLKSKRNAYIMSVMISILFAIKFTDKDTTSQASFYLRNNHIAIKKFLVIRQIIVMIKKVHKNITKECMYTAYDVSLVS